MVSSMSEIRFTPQAISDLTEAKDYIAKLNSEAALRYVADIMDDIRVLQQFPLSGVSLETKLSFATDLRMLVCRHGYVAVYRVEDTVVSVARVLSTKLDYIRVLLAGM